MLLAVEADRAEVFVFIFVLTFDGVGTDNLIRGQGIGGWGKDGKGEGEGEERDLDMLGSIVLARTGDWRRQEETGCRREIGRAHV